MNPDLTKLLRDSVDSAERKRGTVNLLMAGMTGVGKSTLANTVFSENLAATGQGKPVTTGTNEYSKPGFPLTLLDTRGLETARYRETLEQLRKLVIGRQAGDTERQVHAAWLCLSEDGRRVQDAEIELAAMLVRAGVPFLVVITKARADQGFAGVVADLLPGGASPYYSLPAFLVRQGNPQNIQDWDDLARPEVSVIFPNPRTSGNARYTYLAAFAYALAHNGGDEDAAEAFVKAIFDSVPVFDTGGRGATQTFAERGIGDVLVTFEAETGGIAEAYAEQGFERVTPSISLFAAFPVAVVAEVAERNGNAELANAYLEWLYTTDAQRILAEHFYRVTDADVAAEFSDSLPAVTLVTAEEAFGGWEAIQREHFAEGARLDRVFVNQ